MTDLPLLVLNTLLPGGGLLLRGRLTQGLILIVPALVLLSLAVVAMSGAAVDLLPAGIAFWAWSGYAALVVSGAVAWAATRRTALPPDQILGLYRSVATAYLRNELPMAVNAARQLTRRAPSEPGAWRLLALVAHAHGADGLATSASHRAARLDTGQD